MNVVSGPATHCQHTIKVSRGGESRARTSYIQMFRVQGQQVTFRSSEPLSLADGDEVVAAGVVKDRGLTAYAVRNVTTGASLNSGVAGPIIAAIILPLFGLFFTSVLTVFTGKIGWLVYLVFVGVALYQVYQAGLARSAQQAISQPLR